VCLIKREKTKAPLINHHFVSTHKNLLFSAIAIIVFNRETADTSKDEASIWAYTCLV